MTTADALGRLDEHQKLILDEIDRAVDLTALGPDVGQELLAKGHRLILRRLRAYQLFKHAEIFDPAIRGGTARQIAAARRMKADCIIAAEAFRTYVAQWSKVDVAGTWDSYCPGLRTTAERLRSDLAAERGHVCELFAGSEPVRELVP